MSRPSLRARLMAMSDHYQPMRHTFFDLWSEGKLDRRQMGYYLTQHNMYARRPSRVMRPRNPRPSIIAR